MLPGDRRFTGADDAHAWRWLAAGQFHPERHHVRESPDRARPVRARAGSECDDAARALRGLEFVRLRGLARRRDLPGHVTRQAMRSCAAVSTMKLARTASAARKPDSNADSTQPPLKRVRTQ